MDCGKGFLQICSSAVFKGVVRFRALIFMLLACLPLGAQKLRPALDVEVRGWLARHVSQPGVRAGGAIAEMVAEADRYNAEGGHESLRRAVEIDAQTVDERNWRKAADRYASDDLFAYAHALGCWLDATADASWADQLEKISLNECLDFCLHPSDSASLNQLDRTPASTEGRGLGDYVSRLWMLAGNGALVAPLYGSSVLKAEVGGAVVTVEEITAYPFAGKVDFVITPSRGRLAFPLMLRIPSWCSHYDINLNGRPLEFSMSSDRFLCIERKWKAGDRVSLDLKMEPMIAGVEDQGASIWRGPLLYVLDASSGPLNMAIAGDSDSYSESALQGSFSSPVRLTVPAAEVPGWKAENGRPGDIDRKTGTDGAKSLMMLVPFHSAPLRITVFPVSGSFAGWIYDDSLYEENVLG